MRINTIINRYIFREMLPPFAINLVFFTFVFLMGNILRITKLIVNYEVGMGDVFAMISYMVPFFLEYVIPISVMIAVLLTFLRLSGDLEVVAMQAGGLSLWRLLPPVLTFCICGCVLTGLVSIFGVPWGKTAMLNLMYKIATENFQIGLKERTFIDSFEGVTLYINEIDPKNDTLKDVFIEDRRSRQYVSTIVAPKGVLFSRENSLTAHLRLLNGTINRVDLNEHAANTIHFTTYDVSLDLETLVVKPKKKHKHRLELTLSDYHAYFRAHDEAHPKYFTRLSMYHQKFSIPFAAIALGFLAMPLGIMSGTARKTFGLGLCMIFFLLYYVLLFTAKIFAEEGYYSPVAGVWLPNAVVIVIGLYFFVRFSSNRPLNIGFLQHVLAKFRFRGTDVKS